MICNKCQEKIVALFLSNSCGCTHPKTTSDVSPVWTGGVAWGYIVTTYKDVEEYVIASVEDAKNWANINGFSKTHHIVKVTNRNHFRWHQMVGSPIILADSMYYAYHSVTGYNNSSYKNKVLGIEIMKQ